MTHSRIIRQISKIIHHTDPNAKVILYGSQARGDAKEDSDIDLLILLEKDNVTLSDKQTISDPLYDLAMETGITISPLIFSKKNWNSRPFKTPFSVNIDNEGVII